MTASEAFAELEAFWKTAYASADFDLGSHEAFQKSCVRWVRQVLKSDGEDATSLLAPDQCSARKRTPFAAKLPEPYFGRWRDDTGRFSLKGKTVVVLINPGDGICFSQYLDPSLCVLGTPLHELYKGYYVKGAVQGAGSGHFLLYKRSLRAPNHSYRNDGRYFAWGWWGTQFANMLRALGLDERACEEQHFVTLELFAYSSKRANWLDARVVERLKSSRLIVDLIKQLAGDDSPDAPTRIVLVNKGVVWRPLLEDTTLRFERGRVCNRAGRPRAFRLARARAPTAVPVILLNESSMRFPQGEAAQQIFAD